MRSAVNPKSEVIIFDDSDHSYMAGSWQLISVTQFIKQFTPEFDAVAVAAKCAGKGKYAGLAADEILYKWQVEGDRGRREGHNLHRFCECILGGYPVPTPTNTRESKLFGTAVKAIEALQCQFIFMAAEIIIFSTSMGIAGTVDLLMYDPKTNEILILDWKQNKVITPWNTWDNMLDPIDHLHACDTIKYGLQLSIYERILKEYYPGRNFRKAFIHITPNGFYPYAVRRDYQPEIERMLAKCSC